MNVPKTWASLVAQINGNLVGAEGVRDPEFPCDAFVPGKPEGDCETDGHYMCDECTRMKLCECGRYRPSACESECQERRIFE